MIVTVWELSQLCEIPAVTLALPLFPPQVQRGREKCYRLWCSQKFEAIKSQPGPENRSRLLEHPVLTSPLKWLLRSQCCPDPDPRPHPHLPASWLSPCQRSWQPVGSSPRPRATASGAPARRWRWTSTAPTPRRPSPSTTSTRDDSSRRTFTCESVWNLSKRWNNAVCCLSYFESARIFWRKQVTSCDYIID